MLGGMNNNKFLMNNGVPTFLGGIIILICGGTIVGLGFLAFFALIYLLFLGAVAIEWVLSLNVSGWVLAIGSILIIFIVAALQSIWIGLRQK